MYIFIYIQIYLSIHIYTYIPIGESLLSDKVEGSNGAEEQSKRSFIRKNQFTNLDMALRWVKNCFTKQISVSDWWICSNIFSNICFETKDGPRSFLRPKTTSRCCKQRGVSLASRYAMTYHPQYAKLMLPTLHLKEFVEDFQSSFSLSAIFIYIYTYIYTHIYIPM